MKKLNKIIAASLLASAASTGSSVVLAESPLTGNIAVASNYIWRGQTQTSDASATSGGIDYAHSSGVSAGVWVSNLADKSGYEQDIYVGYGGEVGSISYGVSYTAYQYPIGGGDFSELGLSLGFGPATLNVASTLGSEDDDSATFSKGDMYVSLGAEFEISKGLTLGVLAGSYDYENSGTDYVHTNISLSKDDFSIAWDETDEDGAKPRLTVSYSKSFDL